MPSGEIVKSKAPRRWMTVLLVFLIVAAVAVALVWTDASNAQGVDSSPQAWGIPAPWASNSTDQLKCEMVRVWPLPAECLFVFGQ